MFSMLLKRRTVLAAAGCWLAARQVRAAPTAERDTRAQTLFEAILAEGFASDPVGATAVGEHRYDDRWPDVSSLGRERDRERIRTALARLAAFGRQDLSIDTRIDFDSLVGSLELARFTDQIEAPWLHNPLYYTGNIGTGLDELVSREFAPAGVRAASVAARLEKLPGFVEEAITNLRRGKPLAPHSRVAVGQLAGTLLLIQKEIPDKLKNASPALRRRIAAATPAAVAAVEKLRSVVQNELLPGPSENWRLGRTNFERKLRLTLETNLGADAVYALARQEHERVRARMASLARELFVPLFGAAALKTLEASPEADERIIRRVLAELATDHVRAEDLRAACESNLERLSAFVRERKLVPLDGQAILKVIWTPPQQRGVAIAGLAAPAPLDADKPGLPSFYLVQPVPEDWTPERRESFLREYNNFMLEILSIHEAIPGHFVQGYYAKRVPSKVRKVNANGPFVEGWAVYTEHVMVEAGYGGPDPGKDKPAGLTDALWRIKQDPALRAKAIALHGQKFYLRTVTNAILDHAIHAGTMGEEEAVALMVDRSFQQEGEARAKWVRAQVSSTQLSTYFVGAQAWFRLREEAETRAKARNEPFDLMDFHAQALAHGAPPVSRLPELMGWN